MCMHQCEDVDFHRSYVYKCIYLRAVRPTDMRGTYVTARMCIWTYDARMCVCVCARVYVYLVVHKRVHLCSHGPAQGVEE